MPSTLHSPWPGNFITHHFRAQDFTPFGGASDPGPPLAWTNASGGPSYAQVTGWRFLRPVGTVGSIMQSHADLHLALPDSSEDSTLWSPTVKDYWARLQYSFTAEQDTYANVFMSLLTWNNTGLPWSNPQADVKVRWQLHPYGMTSMAPYLTPWQRFSITPIKPNSEVILRIGREYAGIGGALDTFTPELIYHAVELAYRTN